MKPRLRTWNGRAVHKRGSHLYVCAHSAAHACRLLAVAHGLGQEGANRWTSELKHYFCECWGKPMDGITPEVGVWITNGYNSQPERLV